MKDPAVLLYTNDFLSFCLSLNMAERGVFITMLCLQHQKGHLDRKILSLQFIDSDITQDVMKLFQEDENGLLFNPWFDEVIEQRKNYVKSRSENRLGKTNKTKKKSKLPNDS